MAAIFNDSSSEEELNNDDGPETQDASTRKGLKIDDIGDEEDDDDSDDDNNNIKKSNEKSKNNDNDDDDEDNSDKSNKDKPPKKPTGDEDAERDDEDEDKEKPPSRLFIDSEDEDDGDAEFDDGAVVGSSAPAKSSKSKSQLSSATNNDGAISGAGGSSAPASSTLHPKAKRPPQKAEVLEIDRPDKGVTMHMTKLPNLLGIQTEPFEKDTFDPDEEEEKFKGRIHNMIRWRYKTDSNGNYVRDDDGKLVRESNTRIAIWEDGTYTLHIGNEAFELDAIDSTKDGFPGLNGYMYRQQKATFETPEGEEGEENNQSTVLECVGPVASRLLARPSSLQSEAHKSLTVAVRQKTIKKARIAQYTTEFDPEKMKQDRIKIDNETDKIHSRKKSSYRYKQRSPAMNRRYLEEEDEAYDSIDIRSLKRRSDYDEMDDYGDESDGDEDYFKARNNRKRSRRQTYEEEEDEEEEELVFNEESDEDDVAVVKARKKRSNQAVLDDDEDE